MDLATLSPHCGDSKRALRRLLAMREVTLKLMPENCMLLTRRLRERMYALAEPVRRLPADAEAVDFRMGMDQASA